MLFFLGNEEDIGDLEKKVGEKISIEKICQCGEFIPPKASVVVVDLTSIPGDTKKEKEENLISKDLELREMFKKIYSWQNRVKGDFFVVSNCFLFFFEEKVLQEEVKLYFFPYREEIRVYSFGEEDGSIDKARKEAFKKISKKIKIPQAA